MFFCLSFLYLCLSVLLSICLSVFLSSLTRFLEQRQDELHSLGSEPDEDGFDHLIKIVCLCVFLSFYRSVCLAVCLSIYLIVFLSICLYAFLSISLFVCLSVFMSFSRVLPGFWSREETKFIPLGPNWPGCQGKPSGWLWLSTKV